MQRSSEARALRAGDIVDVVAPGFACAPEVLKAGLDYLSSLGLEPRVPKRLFGRDVLCSNSDDARLRHLVDALQAKDSAAVWCVRGGYGSIRLLPKLARAKRPVRAKIFVGLSDLSSVMLFLNQSWGWSSIHGPLLDRFAQGRVAPKWKREMESLIFGRLGEIAHPKLRPMNVAARKNSVVQGQLVGGNLTVLQSSCGTPFQMSGAGKIIFFEDLGERGYRIDRSLEQLTQSNVFRSARAIVFADFTGGDEPSGGNRVRATLQRFADVSSFAVYCGLRTGHGDVQRPLMVGAPTMLTSQGGRAILIQKINLSGVAGAKGGANE